VATVCQLDHSLTDNSAALPVVPIYSESVAIQHPQLDGRPSSPSCIALDLLPKDPTNALAKHGRVDVDGVDLVDRLTYRPVLDIPDHLSGVFSHVDGRPRETSLLGIPP